MHIKYILYFGANVVVCKFIKVSLLKLEYFVSIQYLCTVIVYLECFFIFFILSTTQSIYKVYLCPLLGH